MNHSPLHQCFLSESAKLDIRDGKSIKMSNFLLKFQSLAEAILNKQNEVNVFRVNQPRREGSIFLALFSTVDYGGQCHSMSYEIHDTQNSHLRSHGMGFSFCSNTGTNIFVINLV